jgi:hypothetical protein
LDGSLLPLTPLAMPGPRRLFVLAAAAVAVAAVACLDDRPVASGTSVQLLIVPSLSRARTAVAGLPGVAGTPVIEVHAYTYGQFENTIDLLRAKLPVDTAPRRHLLTIDLLPCLEAQTRATGGGGSLACQMYLELTLRVDTLILDQQYRYITARPGQVIGGLPFTLTVSSNPPVLTVDSAVLVDSTLLRYVVTASDPDGNLVQFTGFYSDSIGAFPSYRSVYHTFFDVVPAFSGPLYQVLNPGASGQLTRRLYLNAYDSKGASDGAVYDSLDVGFPGQTAPIASNVTPTFGLQGIRVTFTVTDPDSNPSRVDVLFHSIPDSLNNYLDTLFSVCSAAIPQGNGLKSVTCPPLLLPRRVQVFVVPFDNTGAGTAASATAVVP